MHLLLSLCTSHSIIQPHLFFGALSVLFLGELIGRKRTIIFATDIMACGALLQATLEEFVQMIVGQVVSGIGNEIATAVTPV